MDKAGILRMVQDAGLAVSAVAPEIGVIWCSEEYPIDEEIYRFAELVEAAVRETVLQAIEAVYTLEEDRNPMFSDGYKYALDQIETLIKARGQR